MTYKPWTFARFDDDGGKVWKIGPFSIAAYRWFDGVMRYELHGLNCLLWRNRKLT